MRVVLILAGAAIAAIGWVTPGVTGYVLCGIGGLAFGVGLGLRGSK